MVVDMTKIPKKEEVKVEQEDKEPLFNVQLTRDEIETIKVALGKSKDFEAFVSVVRGAKENKILCDLESI
jgi:hypothetical protein